MSKLVSKSLRKSVAGFQAGLLVLAVAASLWIFAADPAAADRLRPIVLGETEGWERGRLSVFDYGQNFICANTPNGVLNAADCLVGAGFGSLNLPGVQLQADDIPDLIVIVPFFDSADAGTTLEAFESPNAGDIFTQCPETQSSGFAGGTPFGSFGHCIFHDTMLSTAPLAGVTIITNAGPVTLGGTIPLPNHTHIVNDDIGGSDQPWDIFVVLVLNPAIWPNANGGCPAGSGCLTSFDAVFAASAGTLSFTTSSRVGPVPTTLVLFFGVEHLHA